MKRLLAGLAGLLGSALVALLLLEAGLRLLGYLPSARVPDRLLGYRMAPHARYRWTQEGFSEGRLNAAGWRDREHSEAKPPGTTRILIVGDSFVDASHVPVDSTFHRRLERELNSTAAPRRAFEVIALGLGGIGTTQEYLLYRRDGARYDPDVVAVLFILNDPKDNWPEDPQNPMRPYLLEDGDTLRLDTSFVNVPQFRRWERTVWLRRHTALYPALLQAREALGRRVRPAAGDLGLVEGGGWYRVWNFARRPPADSIPAFRLTEKILARFAGEVRRDGRRFVLIACGSSEEADPREFARFLADSAMDPGKTTRWLEAIGARHGFEVVALNPGLEAAVRAHPEPLWHEYAGRYGHWNAAGHAAVAGILADYFRRALADSAARR